MAQFRTCPDCGAHLDAGEKCDCRNRVDYIIKYAKAQHTSYEEAQKHAIVKEHDACQKGGTNAETI